MTWGCVCGIGQQETFEFGVLYNHRLDNFITMKTWGYWVENKLLKCKHIIGTRRQSYL
jgi:hypothetical protein